MVWLGRSGHTALIPWLFATGCLVAGSLAPRRSEPAVNELERHLAWARRRADACDLLVIPDTGRDGPDLARLATALRTTDSIETALVGATRTELRVLLDDLGEDRAVVQRRLSEYAGQDLACGWARFPDDGLTVEVLVQQARRRAGWASEPAEQSLAERRAR